MLKPTPTHKQHSNILHNKYIWIMRMSTTLTLCQWLGKFLGIIGQIPSVSKSNQLHVVVFWYFFEVWSLDSSKIGIFLKSLQLVISQTWQVYLHYAPMMVLFHLPLKLRSLLTFVYKIQIRHTLMRWHLMSNSSNKHIKLCSEIISYMLCA